MASAVRAFSGELLGGKPGADIAPYLIFVPVPASMLNRQCREAGTPMAPVSGFSSFVLCLWSKLICCHISSLYLSATA